MAINPETKKRLIGLESSYEEPYPIQLRGESSYRANIEKVCGYVDEEEGYNDDTHQAALYLEDDNPVDPDNAVRVEIDDLIVGYLSKPQAKSYRTKLKEIEAPDNAIAICGASIKGGFRKRSGEVADFGVRLDFDLLNLKLVPVRYKDEPKQPRPALEALNAALNKSASKPPVLAAVPLIKEQPKKTKSNKNLPLFIFISVLVVACVIIQMALQSAGIISTPATRTPYVGPLEELRLTKTAQAAELPTQTTVPTLDAYRTQLNDAIAKYLTAYDKFGELHLQLSNNVALLSDQEWRSGMSTALAELQFASDQLIALQSTSLVYDGLDKQLKLLGSETKLMIPKYALALDTLDAVALSSVGDNLINITTYIQNATAELEKINNP
jgi:hypothetical protein